MSNTTTKSLDKIKLLDQMLEDIAGDEFDDYDTSENSASAGVKHHDIAEELDLFDTAH